MYASSRTIFIQKRVECWWYIFLLLSRHHLLGHLDKAVLGFAWGKVGNSGNGLLGVVVS